MAESEDQDSKTEDPTQRRLTKLREEGLVATRREAQSIYYRIADPRAARVLALLYEIYCKG